MVGKAFRQRAAFLTLALCAFSGATAAQEVDAKQAAKQHFEAGNALLARGDVAAALAELQKSRALFPTRGNTLNAAIALQRLGRFDEALELYSSLPRDFELDREQRARVDREGELLRGLTGTLSIRAEPGVSVSVDGRERGSAPFREPLIVLGGSHVVRARQTGHVAYEQRLEIVTGVAQELVVPPLAPEAPEAPTAPVVELPPSEPVAPAAPRVAPSVAPPPPAPAPTPEPELVLALDFGPALGLGFAGDLADRCSGACEASVPLGFAPRARGGWRLWRAAELGFELGYARLAGGYDQRPDTLEPRGSGKQPGFSHDDLAWSAWSLGGYAGWAGRARLHARALFGFGVSFARVRDERRGHFEVTPPVGDRYGADVSADASARSTALYLAPELGAGFNVAPRLELSLGLTLMSSIVLSPARFSHAGAVIQNAMDEPELAYLPKAELTGGVFFALLPRLGVSARF